MGSLLPAGMVWLPALVDAFGIVLDLALPTYCATDPPDDPQLTGDELTAALSDPTTASAAVTVGRVRQLLEHFAWYAFCECIVGTTPPPPSPVPEPVGAPAINPAGQTHSPFAAPCSTRSYDDSWADKDSYADGINQFPGLSPTGIQVDFSNTVHSGNHAGSTLTWTAHSDFNALGTPTASHVITWPTVGEIPSFFMALPPGTVQTNYVWVGHGELTGSVNAHVVESLYCQGNRPGQPSTQQCCPPDPAIMGALQQLLALVGNLHNGTAGPISWHDGVAHRGLSGAGSFVLSGPAIGIRVVMTTLPTHTPVNPGVPTFYWDAGFITPIALDSPLRGQRLVFETESMTLPQFTDSVGYTLLHGTVVDIIELLPTPA